MGRIGFTCGTFDLLHPGHIQMFKDCKKVCDYLIVAIKMDPTMDIPGKNKPIQTIIERQIEVKACRYVDEVMVYGTEKELEDILSLMDIDVRIIGMDHVGKPITGEEICKRRGIELYWNDRDHKFSSSELRGRIKNEHAR